MLSLAGRSIVSNFSHADSRESALTPEIFPLSHAYFRRQGGIEPTQDRSEFWEELFSLGFIHHTLFSELRFISSTGSAANEIPQSHGRLSFPKLIWEVSNRPDGRALIFDFLHDVSLLEGTALTRAHLPVAAPLRGLWPLRSPGILEGSSLEREIANIPPEVLPRWWRNVLQSVHLENGESLGAARISREPPADRLKILTLNVWGVPGFAREVKDRMHRIAEHLRAESYDIAAFQEMWDSRTMTVLKEGGFPHFVTTPRFPGLTGRSGLAICSRFPVQESWSMEFRAFAGIECAVRKGALAARIVLPSGRSVLCVTTHLVSPPEKGSRFLCGATRVREIRMQQAQELKGWVDGIRRPGEDLLVLGDFNAEDGSAERAHLERNLGIDLYRRRIAQGSWMMPAEEASEREGFTFHPKRNRWASGSAAGRLDYIFGNFADPTQVDLAVARAHVDPRAQLSDHFGVTAEILWNGTPKRADIS